MKSPFSVLAALVMEQALVIGASGGIGSAVAHALSQRYAVTRLSRSRDALDITDEASIVAAFSNLSGTFARIVVATGALEIDGHGPEKSINALDPDAMAAQFRVNTLGPALVLKHVRPFLSRNSSAVIAVLAARVGSIGDNRLGGWISYRVAKAGVNQVVRTSAIELARTHKRTCLVALHPGTVATPFTEKYLGRHPSVPPEVAASNLQRVMDQLTPQQSGGFYDYSGAEVPW